MVFTWLMAAANIFQVPILSVYPSFGPVLYRSFYVTLLQPQVGGDDERNGILILLWSSLRIDCLKFIMKLVKVLTATGQLITLFLFGQ